MLRLLFVYFIVMSSVCHAQNFGGFPPALKWQQINTDTARIIFSAAAAPQAARIAQIVHAMSADSSTRFTSRLKKINIVLHSNTTQANGYVALGPFRSEFYLVPGADIFEFGNLPWHENLAVHEYRHVAQYNAFNNGLTKLFSILGGQNGRALANALTVPDWFFEGDAVFAETAYTGLGRGRQPFFLSAYNSLWQEGKAYSWMKLRNGSYKDFVPNHYPLGYLLVNYGYDRYGAGFWKAVTKDASGFKGLVYPFQRAVKEHSGADFKNFRKEALDFYRNTVPEIPFHTKDKTVTNYYFAQPAGSDSLLYLKDSYRHLPAFYVRDKNGEHRLKLRSISSETWLSYRKGMIAYTAFSTDARWSLVDYSDIILLDAATGRERRLTRKAKYFTPDLAPDGSQLISVAINDSLQTELHLIDVQKGAVVKKIASRGGDYFIHPKFTDTEHVVVSVRRPDGTLSLQRLNIVSGDSELLIAGQRSTIGNPSIAGDTVFITASFSGNDDLYAYLLADKKLYQLTSGKTGMYYPAVFKDSLMWSQFTTMGLQLQQRALKQLLWREMPQSPAAASMYPVALTATNLLQSRPRSFIEKNYSKTTGLINFHSWDPGLNFYSNNILNTFAGSVYYRYNGGERAHTTGFAATYGGWFPLLTARVENTFNRHIIRVDTTIVAQEWESSVGYSIPLNFTRGKTVKSLHFGGAFVYNVFQPNTASKAFAQGRHTPYLYHFINWAQELPRARQHIFPRLGYTAGMGYRHQTQRNGYQWLGNTALFLPTFSKTHALVVGGSFQQVDTANTVFSNRFAGARGYRDRFFSRMWNAGFNYHMPLLYPDWGVASLVYFMRVRSNVFFDYTQAFSKDKKARYGLRSTGAELYFDTKWWNQLPVTFGVRYSYLLDARFAGSNRNVFEVILPVNLIPF